ncbi:hypothetical protein DCCM_3688 [Desulfocucumis palustris]|uniref:Radical SAM core domain-containing protein n=1 Tax=Desulfocucumis palustris TaxID=1898651 RepID=A0A2L2XDX9_9FIRM|nr:DUF512 domain-containing protein [Desulfocucumis palustris]GBF34569.1 hypothetical protein DCCM_3688 [Desulfocucumis palustris]
MSKTSLYDLLLYSAARNNILAITSTCNVRCIFCSHRQNPPGIDSRNLPPVSPGQVDEMLDYIDPSFPLVIGESVTRIMEGEPFTHPDIKEILSRIRRRFPETVIKITTNGNLLDPDNIIFLSSLGGMVVNLSLNSASERNRKVLMNDSRAAVAVRAPGLLREYGLEYHGSIVAMPHITGWEDIAETVRLFDRQGARTVRIFMPGYTRFAPEGLPVPGFLPGELAGFVENIKCEVKIPVIAEPPNLSDLAARLAGVVGPSPAGKAGLKTGDEIIFVNGLPVLSRVDAFKRVLKAVNPELNILRDGEELSVRLVKGKDQTSGLVMDCDLEPDTLERIRRAVRRNRSGRALALSSEFGFPVLRAGLQKFLPGEKITVIPVKNRYFGGSIGCAGLLTVEDMSRAVGLAENSPDLVILPAIAFDHRGRDITGRNYMEAVGEYSLAVETI